MYRYVRVPRRNFTTHAIVKTTKLHIFWVVWSFYSNSTNNGGFTYPRLVLLIVNVPVFMFAVSNSPPTTLTSMPIKSGLLMLVKSNIEPKFCSNLSTYVNSRLTNLQCG